MGVKYSRWETWANENTYKERGKLTSVDLVDELWVSAILSSTCLTVLQFLKTLWILVIYIDNGTWLSKTQM